MNTATTLLPALLLLYFLWRSLRQRVFLLGLPFLMDMYYSVFFDRLKIFWVPNQWLPADHMMFWLFATWIVYFDLLLPGRRRSVRELRLFGPRLSAPEEVVLVGFAAYAFFRVGTTAVRFMDLGTAISEARIPLYVFAGYFLLRGILSHAGRKETVDLLAAVVVVNTIAAGFYVLHQGLHMYIYSGLVEHTYLVVNGEVLTRSFYFMPQYLPLAIAFCAAKRKWNVLWLGVFVVTLAAIWVSYTRALILVVIVEIVVILAVRLLKHRDAWPAAKRVLQIVLLVGVFVGAAVALLPTQSAYLFSRIEETRSSGSALEDNNLQYRLIWWRTTNEWMRRQPPPGRGIPVRGTGCASDEGQSDGSGHRVGTDGVEPWPARGRGFGRPLRGLRLACHQPEPRERRRRRVPLNRPPRRDRRRVPARLRRVDHLRPVAHSDGAVVLRAADRREVSTARRGS